MYPAQSELPSSVAADHCANNVRPAKLRVAERISETFQRRFARSGCREPFQRPDQRDRQNETHRDAGRREA